MPASVHGEEGCCAIRHRKDLLQQEALTPDAGPARRNAAWIPGKPFSQLKEFKFPLITIACPFPPGSVYVLTAAWAVIGAAAPAAVMAAAVKA